MFPVSDRSQSVLQALQIALRQNHVAVETAHVTGIRTENSAVTGVEADGRFLSAKWVILATGGLSYPTTGSTGEGYRMAEALGHTRHPLPRLPGALGNGRAGTARRCRDCPFGTWP